MPLDQSNLLEEEKREKHRRNREAFLMGEADETGIKKLVALLAGHSISVLSGESQERISEIFTGSQTFSKDAVIQFNPF